MKKTSIFDLLLAMLALGRYPATFGQVRPGRRSREARPERQRKDIKEWNAEVDRRKAERKANKGNK